MKLLWASLGLIAFGLGFVGLFLPLLPTAPFMLLAAFFFARSSERLHGWLLNHPTFGPSIQDWQERGAISLRAKRLASLSILASFGLSFLLGVPPMIIAVQTVTLLGVTVFIWSRPNA